MDTIDEMMAYLKSRGGSVYIYGCGNFGKQIYRVCREYGIPIAGFMNTTISGTTVLDCPVKKPEEVKVSGGNMEEITIVIGNIDRRNEILDHLLDMGFRNIISNLPQIKIELEKTLNCAVLEKLGERYEYIGRSGKKWWYGYIADKCSGRKLFRLSSALPVDFEAGYIEDMYWNVCLLPYEKKHGDISAYKDNVRVYMAFTGKDEVNLAQAEQDGLIPVQAGAALTDKDFGTLRDDSGENISVKNGNYSECTALYWIWKNAFESDYIGLCHYRRRLCISVESIEHMEKNGIDIVCSIPEIEPCSLYDFYTVHNNFLSAHDWRMMAESIASCGAPYEGALTAYQSGCIQFPNNISIMRRDAFAEYCKFVFYVTEDVERYYEKSGVIRADRYLGYMIEILTGFFIMCNKGKYKIAYSDMELL